jgi:hypothetical protein
MIALAAGSMAACADNLEVKNLNNPDLGRVYAVPGGVQGVISTLYRTYHQTTQGSAEGLNSQSKVMALESYGQVANFGMALRAGIPRDFIANTRGNQVAAGNNTNWSSLSRLMRTSATVAQAVDAYLARGATLGNTALDQRARSFAFFANGIAMGTLALGYDSVAIATPQTPTSAIPEFVTPAVAAAEAIKILDSAQAIITAPGIDGNSLAGIPADWMGGTALTTAEYVRLIRSYKAKIRAGVARTPDERAAVDWAAVVADAAAGITADHRINLNPTTGWSSGLDAGTFQTSASWHQISLFYNGMADTSGAYQAWIALPLATRVGMNVVVQTPDRRWPSGATRAAQVANSTLPLAAGRYIANRNPGEDQPDNSNPWGTSQYDHRRWFAIVQANGVGTYTFMSRQEIAMLQAEGMLRPGSQNNPTAAMALVNASRTANGLAAFTDPNTPPGGTACVPRLPNGSCGSLLEAMKYEKRMETQLTGYMQWFIDSRGWGDLVQGTSLHWPVPFQEMDTRNKPFYNMPSTGTLPASGPSTYGF